MPRTDSAAKSNGTALFTQDVELPGMLTALVLHPPRFGARVKSFDASGLKAIPGVRAVVELPTGVAVLATGFWAAKTGRDALKVEWNDNRSWRGSTDELMAEYRKLAQTPGKVARADGDAAKALAGAAKVLEATFEFPYLAHAAMEPLNCVMRLTEGRCEAWYGAQSQTADQAAIAQVTGLKPEQVTIETLYAGGGFGRRANPRVGLRGRVRARSSRASRSRARAASRSSSCGRARTTCGAGHYRPAYLHTMRAGLDASGAIVGWQHRSSASRSRTAPRSRRSW